MSVPFSILVPHSIVVAAIVEHAKLLLLFKYLFSAVAAVNAGQEKLSSARKWATACKFHWANAARGTAKATLQAMGQSNM